MPADRLVPLPDGIDDATAAAMMLKGMTAQYLLRRTFGVRPGDTVLFHAAAGGVGLIAGQWAKDLGATVIGTVGGEEKAELAQGAGCDHTIIVLRARTSSSGSRRSPAARVCRGLRFGRQGHLPGSLDCLSRSACSSRSATPRGRCRVRTR